MTTSTLSDRAIAFAIACGLDDVQRTTRRLYRFNNVPAGDHWRTRLATPADVRRFLSLDAPPPWSRGLRANLGRPDAVWWHWSRPRRAAPDADAAPTAGSAGLTWKLYLSPQPRDLPDAFHAAAPLLARSQAVAFKIGCDLYGLLRTDKMVAYFQTPEARAAAAAALLPALAGLPAHGVPFTHCLGGGGLLSAGVDPPGGGGEGARRYSWRSWICASLGRWLHDGRGDGAAAGDAALARLAALGVCTETWALDPAAWTQEAAE